MFKIDSGEPMLLNCYRFTVSIPGESFYLN